METSIHLFKRQLTQLSQGGQVGDTPNFNLGSLDLTPAWGNLPKNHLVCLV